MRPLLYRRLTSSCMQEPPTFSPATPPSELPVLLKPMQPLHQLLPAASNRSVVEGAGRLYDVIISMELIIQWSAFVDPLDNTLYYRPRYWKGGDKDTYANLPMLIREKKPVVPMV
jgi:hypothetical protein